MSAEALLDVNVLIAMAWPAHAAHEKVHKWLALHARKGWATCPITETAFVRILSNPAFSPDALTPADALELLRANLGHPAHRFWADEVGIADAVQPFANRVLGHQQVTDAYLVGLAIRKKGKFVTMDRAVLGLLSERAQEREIATLI